MNISNLNMFFKNLTKKPLYLYSFLAVPFGIYFFDITNKFQNIIKPKDEEIIDEDELMESESVNDESEIEETYFLSSIPEEESNQNTIDDDETRGTYFLLDVIDEEPNNKNFFTRFINYMMDR